MVLMIGTRTMHQYAAVAQRVSNASTSSCQQVEEVCLLVVLFYRILTLQPSTAFWEALEGIPWNTSHNRWQLGKRADLVARESNELCNFLVYCAAGPLPARTTPVSEPSRTPLLSFAPPDLPRSPADNFPILAGCGRP